MLFYSLYEFNLMLMSLHECHVHEDKKLYYEHEISTACKTKMLEKTTIFLAFKLWDVLLIMLINIKMQTIVFMLLNIKMQTIFIMLINIKMQTIFIMLINVKMPTIVGILT